MAGEAVNEVRRSLQRQGAQLKGALWSLRGNPWNLEPDELQTRTRLAREYKPLGRALALRAALQDVVMKLLLRKDQSFFNVGANGQYEVDWRPSKNWLKPFVSRFWCKLEKLALWR
jgi:hypothetical protein